MIRWLISSLLDEFFGVVLLHEVLRFADRPPLSNTAAKEIDGLRSGDLSRFYAPKPAPANLHAHRHEVGRTTHAVIEDFIFASPVRTAFPHSDLVRGRHWRCLPAVERSPDGQGRLVEPEDGPRKTLVVIDGIVQFGYLTERLYAQTLNPRGIDVVTIDLPFNHHRTPAGYRPGQLILGGDIDHTLAVLRQTVLDVWSLVRGLQAENRSVALAGISFGGWTVLATSLVASNLASVTAVAPPVDMLTALTEGGVIVRAAKRGLNLSANEVEQLRPVARAISPFQHAAPLPPDRIFLHGARYDRFIPTNRVKQLATNWGSRFTLHTAGHIELTGLPPWVLRVARDVGAVGWQ